MQAVDRLGMRTYFDSEAKLHGSLIEHVAASSDATLVPSWCIFEIDFQKSHQAQTHMILTTKSG